MNNESYTRVGRALVRVGALYQPQPLPVITEHLDFYYWTLAGVTIVGWLIGWSL
jgi:hypothetical protein